MNFGENGNKPTSKQNRVTEPRFFESWAKLPYIGVKEDYLYILYIILFSLLQCYIINIYNILPSVTEVT
jgi:hypothetical protein